MVHGAESVGDPVLAAVADQDQVGLAQVCAAVGARAGGVRPGRLHGLAGLPVRPLHRPRHHVLEPAEDRPAIAGVLGQAEAVGGLDRVPAPCAPR